MGALSEELSERLAEDSLLNKRVARTLTVGWRSAGRGAEGEYNIQVCIVYTV